TVYAPSLKAVYTEIARVLKPGGVFGVYEWLMTDDFHAKNAKHVEIRQRIERGDGVVNMLSVREGLEAFGGSALQGSKLISCGYEAPKLALEALRTQGMSVWGMRDGGREGIFTTGYLMVGRKPEEWVHPGKKET
ncbi:MAG: hypothetical protein Q9226_007222, partial [Calogaya cf. arnoldii]